jgi:hypothetical protein
LTPTPYTAVECIGARKVYVTWVAKDPLNLRVAVSATGCPQHPSCDEQGDGELVSQPPITLNIVDAAGNSFAKTINDPGFNSGGCPGGHDTYRGTGRMRFVYGASTTVIGKHRVLQAEAIPPGLTPPIQVNISDAGGGLYSFVANTCSPRITSISTGFKCF